MLWGCLAALALQPRPRLSAVSCSRARVLVMSHWLSGHPAAADAAGAGLGRGDPERAPAGGADPAKAAGGGAGGVGGAKIGPCIGFMRFNDATGLLMPSIVAIA
jgi:hypothetical protein